MKNTLTLVIAIFCTLFSTAQELSIDKFVAIDVSAGHEVTLIQSSENRVEVKMIKGDRDNLKVEVSDGELSIGTKKSRWGNKTRAEVKVYFSEEIRTIEVSSGASLDSEATLRSKKMDIEASSGATCRVKLEVQDLDVEVSSGARVTTSGVAKAQAVEVSSGAKYSGDEMKCEYTSAEVNSGAKADVYASKRLSAEANSGGSVIYRGNPADKDIQSSKWSGGSVRSAN